MNDHDEPSRTEVLHLAFRWLQAVLRREHSHLFHARELKPALSIVDAGDPSEGGMPAAPGTCPPDAPPILS